MVSIAIDTIIFMATPFNLDRPELWVQLYEGTQGDKILLKNSIDFGKNYVQTVTIGVNNNRESWSVAFHTSNKDNFSFLILGLDQPDPGYLLWTDPITYAREGGYVPRRWELKEPYQVTPISPTSWQVSMKLYNWRS